MKPAGIRVRGRKSTPGRYFQVAEPGLGWGGTDVSDPLQIIEKIDPKQAWPGLRLLMVSTTGEHSAWFELDRDLKPQRVASTHPGSSYADFSVEKNNIRRSGKTQGVATDYRVHSS